MKKTETAVRRCKTMSTLQKILGGKWKLEILYYISFCGIRRFGALRRQLGEITESSLTKQHEGMLLTGLLPLPCSACFLLEPRTTSPGMAPLTMDPFITD